MSDRDIPSKEQVLEQRVRESGGLLERLEDCRRRIGKMCSERRGPRMSIPVEWNDDDYFICLTIKDAIADLMQPAPETAAEHPLDPRMIEACEALRSLLMQCKPYLVKADREGPHAHPRVLLNQINALLDSPVKTPTEGPL